MEKISFIMPSRNGKKYLEWAYNSIRKNLNPVHEICMYDDASTDGTWEYMNELKEKDKNIQIFRNEGPERVGHTIGYDFLIDKAKNEICMIFHNDMYACKGLDETVLEYIEPKIIVSATRIEPPLHPEGPEKIILDCGIEPEEFNENRLISFVGNILLEHTELKKEPTTEGIFAPWAFYKSDFQKIGGHDPLFAPQSKEDSDIFNRFMLNGIKFIQTWKGFVYHMTCRGSRFADGAKRNPDGQVYMKGRETTEWLTQNQKSTRNFIRKWGSMVRHDQYLKPIIPHKYDIGFVIDNASIDIIRLLEPHCSTIYSDLKMEFLDQYIKEEQPNTLFNLYNKFKWIDSNKINDILVEFNAKELNNDRLKFLLQLPDIIYDSGEIGIMKYDIFKLDIKRMVPHEKNLIKLKNMIYL